MNLFFQNYLSSAAWGVSISKVELLPFSPPGSVRAGAMERGTIFLDAMLLSKGMDCLHAHDICSLKIDLEPIAGGKRKEW